MFAGLLLNPFIVLAIEHLARMERTSGNGNICDHYLCQKEIKPREHRRTILTGTAILWECLLIRFVSFPADGGFCGCSWGVMTGLSLEALSVETDSPTASFRYLCKWAAFGPFMVHFGVWEGGAGKTLQPVSFSGCDTPCSRAKQGWPMITSCCLTSSAKLTRKCRKM